MRAVSLFALLALGSPSATLTPSFDSIASPANLTVMQGYQCYTRRPGAPKLQYSDCAKVFGILYNSLLFDDRETYDRDTLPGPWTVPPATRISRQNPCVVELQTSSATLKESLTISQIFYAATELIYHCRETAAGGLMQVGMGRGFHVILRSMPRYGQQVGEIGDGSTSNNTKSA